MLENKEKQSSEEENEVSEEINLKANYTSMMYLLTEQQALIGVLLNELLRSGVLEDSQITKITNIYGQPEILNPVYKELYSRFAYYFMQIRQALSSPEEASKIPPLFPEFPEKAEGQEKNIEGKEKQL